MRTICGETAGGIQLIFIVDDNFLLRITHPPSDSCQEFFERTINAYGQPPSSPVSGAVAGPAATAYFIKFKVKPGKNAAFAKAISEMMVGVREEVPGNVYWDLLHVPQDPLPCSFLAYERAERTGVLTDPGARVVVLTNERSPTTQMD